MKSLLEVIQDAEQRSRLINDTARMIDRQVASKKGASGFAIKAGYKVVSKLKGGRMIPGAVGALLNDFAGAVEPLHAEYRDGGDGGGFARFLGARESAATKALLAITDRRIGEAENKVIKNTYRKLRPMAERQVAAAIPDVGDLVDRYTA